MNRFGTTKFHSLAFGLALLTTCVSVLVAAERGAASAELSDYREPGAPVTALLTAPTPPEPLLHARSGRVALLFREPVMSMERLARPRMGLAGFRFDPESGTSGVGPLISRVEIVSTSAPADQKPVAWAPKMAPCWISCTSRPMAASCPL